MEITVQELVKWVKRSQFFLSNLPPAQEKLLDYYAEQYPAIPTPDQISSATGLQGPTVTTSLLHNRLLESFEKDHSLWRAQKILHVSSKAGLGTTPLSTAKFIAPTKKFWFAQCVRLQNKSSEPRGGRQTLIVFSEPLFFFSRRLQGYFRFLDINHEGHISKEDAVKLVRKVKSQIRRALPDNIKDLVPDLDLEPCRNYIPAGDSYAAVRIRRWFRYQISRDAAIQYKESSDVATNDRIRTNMIVLASRSSFALLHQFQTTTPELDFHLTARGIKHRSTNLESNDGSNGNGTSLARVIVTNWTFDTGNVHTYIASNHTRALDAVADLLVDDTRLAPISEVIIGKDKLIPSRFQIVFEVPLLLNETQHGEPRFLYELSKIYPEVDRLE